MDAKLVNPIIDAFKELMPQMGFPDPKQLKIYLQGKNVLSKGVTIKVGFIQQVRGNVIYNMSEETAKFIASTMMMGVPVTKFGDLVQSALRELGNMLTAHAATSFTNLGLQVDITTPKLLIGENPEVDDSDNYINVEMSVGEHKVDISICVDRAV